MELPSWWNILIRDKNAEALKSLDKIYNRAINKFKVNAKDLRIDELRLNLQNYDLTRHFEPQSKAEDTKEIAEGVHQLLTDDIPDLSNTINSLRENHKTCTVEKGNLRLENCVSVGALKPRL